MPREQVVYPTSYVWDKDGKKIDEGRPSYVKSVPEGGHLSTRPGIALHWNREAGHLQLSATIHEEQLRAILKRIEDGTMETADGFYGVYVDLTRTEANNLIKGLRRGRDSAYGADA